MKDTRVREVERVLRDGAALDRAIVAARARVIRRHRLLGLPLVVWRDGRVVKLEPGSVELPDVVDADNAERP